MTQQAAAKPHGDLPVQPLCAARFPRRPASVSSPRGCSAAGSPRPLQNKRLGAGTTPKDSHCLPKELKMPFSQNNKNKLLLPPSPLPISCVLPTLRFLIKNARKEALFLEEGGRIADSKGGGTISQPDLSCQKEKELLQTPMCSSTGSWTFAPK